jgi:Protein of unknown function (DUF2846)
MPTKSLLVLAVSFLSFIAHAQEYATVYFYRSASLKGAAINYNIYDDTVLIGKMPPGQVLMYYAKPGERQFIAKMESQSTALMTVEAGKSYFVECGVSVGVVVGNPTMRQVTSQRGIPAIAKINPNLKINIAQLGDFEMDETEFKSDTVRALSNLFERKRKGGKTRGVIFLIWGVAGLAAGDPAVLPGVITLGVISATGFSQAGKYKAENLAPLVKDYQSGKPLPPKIKKKFKEKDFK